MACKVLRAQFMDISADRMSDIIRRMNKRSGSDDQFTITESELGRIVVTGKPQAVMFLIGEIAGIGEDGLLSVA